MKHLIVFALIFISVLPQSIGQVKTPAISTIGIGKMRVLPDQAAVYFNLHTTGMEYNGVLKDLNKKASQLEEEVGKAGFDKKMLKTTSYSIDKNYSYHNGSRKDSGFIGRQSFILTFRYDEKKVRSLITTISKGAPDASFNFGFNLSEAKRDSVRNELLTLAFKDAEDQAKALARAAGVQLKTIISIKPSENLHPMAMQERMMMKEGGDEAEFSGFNRQEQELTEDIRVEWAFEQ